MAGTSDYPESMSFSRRDLSLQVSRVNDNMTLPIKNSPTNHLFHKGDLSTSTLIEAIDLVSNELCPSAPCGDAIADSELAY